MFFNKEIQLTTKAIAIACFASMVLSWKVWLNERNFPTTPVFSFLPTFLHPIDFLFFGSALIVLLAIVFFKKSQKIIIVFLFISISLALLDLNRWQPWFYQYVVMFFVLSFYNSDSKDNKHQTAILLCFKIMVASIYIWSGLQKLNPNFLSDTFPWLLEPITSKLGEESISYFEWLGYAFPLIEIATGILLLTNKLKKAWAILAVLMHLFILFVLGPLGHNYNSVVWPWNLFMIFMMWQLFLKSTSITKNNFTSSIDYHSIKLVLILFVMMPLFNFFNKWDSYLSHNLYSGNTSNGVIYISNEIKNKLPDYMKSYVSGDNNEIQIKYWCMTELGIPPYPEKRNFEAVAKTFYNYSSNKSEVYFEFTPKTKVEM